MEGKKGIRSYYEAFDETGDKRRMLYHVPAGQLETLVLAGVCELTVAELVPPVVDVYSGFVSEAEAECHLLEQQLGNLANVAAAGAQDSPTIGKKISQVEAQLVAAQERVRKYSIQRAEQQAAARQVASSLDELKMLACNGDNVIRERIGKVLRRLIARIYVGTPGSIYWDLAADNLLKQLPGTVEVIDDGELNMKAISDTFPDSSRRRSLSVTIFFATGVIRVLQRIGRDWQLLSNCPIGDGDCKNARSNVFLFGYQKTVSPEFPKERAQPVPEARPLQIPLWFEKAANAIVQQEMGEGAI